MQGLILQACCTERWDKSLMILDITWRLNVGVEFIPMDSLLELLSEPALHGRNSFLDYGSIFFLNWFHFGNSSGEISPLLSSDRKSATSTCQLENISCTPMVAWQVQTAVCTTFWSFLEEIKLAATSRGFHSSCESVGCWASLNHTSFQANL